MKTCVYCRMEPAKTEILVNRRFRFLCDKCKKKVEAAQVDKPVISVARKQRRTRDGGLFTH